MSTDYKNLKILVLLVATILPLTFITNYQDVANAYEYTPYFNGIMPLHTEVIASSVLYLKIMVSILLFITTGTVIYCIRLINKGGNLTPIRIVLSLIMLASIVQFVFNQFYGNKHEANAQQVAELLFNASSQSYLENTQNRFNDIIKEGLGDRNMLDNVKPASVQCSWNDPDGIPALATMDVSLHGSSILNPTVPYTINKYISDFFITKPEGWESDYKPVILFKQSAFRVRYGNNPIAEEWILPPFSSDDAFDNQPVEVTIQNTIVGYTSITTRSKIPADVTCTSISN